MATAVTTFCHVFDIVGGAAGPLVGVASLQRASPKVHGDTLFVSTGMVCALQVYVWLLVLGLGYGGVQKFTEEEFDGSKLQALRLFILPDPGQQLCT